MLSRRVPLKDDVGGGDALLPTVVLLGTFILVSSLFIAGMGHLVALNIASQSPEEPIQYIGDNLFEFSPLDADPNGTVLPGITDVQLTSKYFSVGIPSHKVTWTKTGLRDVSSYVIRNATVQDKWENLGLDEVLVTDYIIFYQSQKTWGGLSHKFAAAVISFDEITEHRKNTTELSDVSFHLFNWFNVRTQIGPGFASFNDAIWSSRFNYTVASSLNASIATASPWALVGAFLSFSLPNVDPMINLLMAIPIWLAIGYLVLMVVRSFIPTLGG